MLFIESKKADQPKLQAEPHIDLNPNLEKENNYV
jgi:hypothetical protein